jgi:hypothetical protein
MKKSNLLFERLPFYKMGFLSFLLTFLFFAGVQTDMKAQIQPQHPVTGNSVKALEQIPPGAFVAVPIAKDRLGNAILGLKNQLPQFAEGSAPYMAAYRRLVYYNEILRNLNAGKGVAESITVSLKVILSNTNPPVLATPEEAVVEKSAAISLLR